MSRSTTKKRTAADKKRAIKRRKQQLRRACKRYRDNIKRNDKLYEEHLAKDRLRKQKAKEEGKLRLSHREQVKKRRKHAEYMREYRRKKKEQSNQLNEDSSHTNDENVTPNVPTKQQLSGRKRVRRDRSRIYRENQQLKRDVSDLQRQVWKLQKREVRRKKKIASPDLTPKKKMSRILAGKFSSAPVRRELFKGLVVQEELKSAKRRIGDNVKEKRCYGNLVTGAIMKKYRILNQCRSLVPARSALKGRKLSVHVPQDSRLNVHCKASGRGFSIDILSVKVTCEGKKGQV